jgi:Ca2+/Na+ antiporter
MVELGEWILEHYQKILLAVLVLWGAEYAYTRPYSLGDPATYVALIVGQLLLAGVFHYRRVFFAAVMASFLGAGLTLPLKGVLGAARWPILAVAAIVGLVLWLKEDRQHFGAMHVVAMSCAVAALTSATVSAFPRIAFLKAISLLLLLLYASAGARIAMLNREREFVHSLVNASEFIGYLAAACYFGLHLEIFGNPNSLGAVAGTALVPLAIWAVWAADTQNMRRRRLISLAVCVVLLVVSRSRAGLLSSALVAAFFLLGLRRYRLFLRAATVCVAAVALVGLWNPELLSRTSDDVNTDLIYKGHREKGLLGSREKPWNATMETIREHPYFGGGFGTTATGAENETGASAVATTAGTSREHGNSYLALLEWVGLLGIVPFLFLIGGILLEIKTVCFYMLRTLDGGHPAVPLAMVCLSGLVGAVFEDWLFAVGYYLSVFTWSMAFCLVDLTRHPISPAPVTMPMPTRGTWAGGGARLSPHHAGRR